MKLKIAGKLSASAAEALDDLVQPLYGTPGMRVLGIVELAHIERNQPAPDEGAEPSVTCGIKLLEIAHGEQVEHLRKAMRALHVQRTARGTLDEEMQEWRLSKGTLEDLGDHFALRETARLRAAMEHQASILLRLRSGSMPEADLRKQLDKLHTIVRGVLDWAEPEDEEPLEFSLKTATGVVTATAKKATAKKVKA